MISSSFSYNSSPLILKLQKIKSCRNVNNVKYTTNERTWSYNHWNFMVSLYLRILETLEENLFPFHICLWVCRHPLRSILFCIHKSYEDGLPLFSPYLFKSICWTWLVLTVVSKYICMIFSWSKTNLVRLYFIK